MVEFYYISRSILCKNEHHFDIYDIAFANYFKEASIKFPEEIQQEIWDWLNKNITVLQLHAVLEELFPNMSLEELEEEFRKLLREQNEEQNFGNQWIGTQGQSKFGNMGQNLAGIRIAGEYGMQNAVKIAQKRMFKDYRKDLVMNTRQIKIALKRLRKLDDIGKKDELDLKKTIDETGRNGGEIELFFSKRKKNNIKLLLLMDVGGTMDPYIHQVNLLFSAANDISHWKDFKYYYFHNCIYNYLYHDGRRNKERAIDFDDFLKKYDSSYRVIIVGDQCMYRSELVNPHGAIYDDASNKKSGIFYISEIADHFKKNVIWMNPEPVQPNWMSWPKLKISKIIPTFHLSIKGIEKAMDYLSTGGKNQDTTVDQLKDVILALY
ncbi:MAG: VWA domain-containing protein [Candidatus Lokiarchaeota archaeon]|nr:VWA domain-containing protein [Candidatus Lokiarchaeota archaeon]